ncbi:MAG TPA: ammonium transporter, partial [Blastocatellia bacterium]|nr:ammonium transporter [Blastocatellia bacterium]
MTEKKLRFSRKISRLRVRLRDPEWRRYGALLLTGKLLAVGLLLLGVAVLNPDLIGLRVFAAEGDALTGSDIVNP